MAVLIVFFSRDGAADAVRYEPCLAVVLRAQGRQLQCRKCLTPVNTMAMPCSSAALITSSSRIEPPGWITAVAPASIAASSPSANGKERVGGDHRAFGQRLGELQLARAASSPCGRDARRIDPAHLSRADADGGQILGIDDGVRLHVLGDAEGEFQVAQFGIGRRALGHDLQAHVVDHGVVARLHQKPPATVFTVRPIARGSGRPPASSSRRFFFAADDRDRFLGRIGRDDDFGEDLGDRARGRRHPAAD